jgi:hydroxypyruvate isomerase
MTNLTRRGILAGAASAVSLGLAGSRSEAVAADDADWKITNGRINQSVCQWCFNPMSVEELARAAAALGFKSVELVAPEHFPTLKKYGLACAIASSHGFVKGFNHVENHEECLAKLTASIDAMHAAGWTNVITFSGMRQGISDEVGIKNTVAGLKKIIGYAEQKNVTLCLEVLNSRVAIEMKGHPDYQADRIEWAVEVCDKVGSDRLKILFDIYHVQIMQGDVIARIQQYKDYIGHYHTAGVPGRNELDERQELNYPPIMRAIVETGYKGFVGQEFIPRESDKIASLRAAARLCDV